MQVILADEQIHQIQLLIADLIKREVENRLDNRNIKSPFLNKQQACDYLGIMTKPTSHKVGHLLKR